MPSTSDYTSIRAIEYQFIQHTDEQYRQAHHKLNAQYAGVLTDISDVLTGLSDQQDIHSLIKTKIIESMSEEPEAQQKLRILFNRSMILKWHTYNPDSFVKMNLKDTQFAFDDAVATNNSCIRIKININSIHFKHNFAANNIDHLSSEPFIATPETSTMAATPTQPPITPEQMIQTFLDRLSGTRPTTRPDTDAATGGTQTQTTGNMINPDNLPADVRSRYIQGQQHCLIMTKQDRVPFRLTDSTGNTRPAHHFMDGPHRLINRSGDLYYFSKWDEKRQKTFISRAPKPLSKPHSPAILRGWYIKFHAHAKAYGIYVHNYFDFRPLTGDPKGFTCGDDTLVEQYDVPLLLESKLGLWSLLIHAALQDIFSISGTNEYRIVQRQHGLGYEALFDLIRVYHPSYDLYPTLQTKDRPSQQDKQTISDFFNEYILHLRLRAYVENISANLNNPQERDTFIGSLRGGKEILDLTYDERASNNPAKMMKYQQGNLVPTLEEVSQRLPPLT